MKRILQLILMGLTIVSWNVGNAQITVTGADYGGAGTSLTIVQDTAINTGTVGSGGVSQNWDFSTLGVDVIENLQFEDPVNTTSGWYFPNADIAIEGGNDTSFFRETGSGLWLDGISGDILDQGINVIGDFNPNQLLIEFPSTYLDSFMQVAQLDTTVEDIYTGGFSDSLRLKRIINTTSKIDGWGDVTTPSGTFTTIRQSFTEETIDTVWALIFGSWQQFLNQSSITYRYRWIANGEDFPVLDILADAPNGTIIDATYKVGDSVLAQISSFIPVSCNGECDGEATATGVGGTGSYTYQWDVNANSQTTATATGLCAGTYSVTVSDGVSSKEVSVTIDEPDEIVITGVVSDVYGDSTNTNGSIDISITGGVPEYNYEWSGPDSYSAATQDLDSVGLGTYSVTVTDDNGCTGAGQFTVGVNVSVNELAGFPQLRIYPNPTTGILWLNDFPQAFGEATLFDIVGNQIKQLQIVSGDNVIDLSVLPQGIYILQIEAGKSKHIQRIAVTK